MVPRTVSSIVVLALLAASAQAADPQLVMQLKQLGQAVDNMSANISKAESDEDAAMLAKVTQQTFATQLGGDPKPQVSVTASRGHCDVQITTPQWKLWSRAENGAIVDHGAKIN